ncbi:MAG: hypothetical protein NC485_14370 [Ruminococcus flavefaciens]|nr:hypothetical protein [Ruminococcus flavefaciens]
MKSNRKCFLSAALVILILLSSCLLCACTDYVYTYYFSVEGGNGTISMFADDAIYESDRSPIQIEGGKTIGQFVFIASPSDGYKVKQWTCDGEIIQGNKTTIYMSKKTQFTQGRGAYNG